MAHLFIHKDAGVLGTTKGTKQVYKKLTSKSINLAINTMVSRKAIALTRIDGLPMRDGMHDLILRQLDFSSYPGLIVSLKHLRNHFMMAAQLLNRLPEIDRTKLGLDSSKLIDAITTYVQTQDYIASTMASFAPTLAGRVFQGPGAAAVTNVRKNKDSGEEVETPLQGNIAGSLSQWISPAVSAIYNASSAANAAKDGDIMMVDLIAYLMTASASDMLNSAPVLSDSVAAKQKIDQLRSLYLELGQLTLVDWSRPKGEDIPVPTNFNDGLDLLTEESCMDGLALAGGVFIVDQMVSYVMDGPIYNILFSEEYSKNPRSQNEMRKHSLERLASYFQDLLLAPALISKELIDLTREELKAINAMTWKSATYMADNYTEHVGPLVHPALKKYATAIHTGLNDPNLQPYPGAPTVILIEAAALLGYGHIFHDCQAAANERSNEFQVGEIATPRDLLNPKIRSIMSDLGFASHTHFSNASLYISANAYYERILVNNLTVLPSSTFAKIAPAAVIAGREALNACPVPIMGPIMTHRVPQFGFNVLMNNEIVDLPGAVPLNATMIEKLNDKLRFSYFGSTYLHSLLSAGNPIILDKALAANISKAVGVSWRAAYPADLLPGIPEMIGALGSHNPHTVLAYIGKLINRSYSELSMDIFDANLFKVIITALSSSYVVFSIPDGPYSSKESALLALAEKGFTPLEGYGKPYGLNYNSLAANCVIATASTKRVSVKDEYGVPSYSSLNELNSNPTPESILADITAHAGFLTDDYDTFIMPLRRIPVPKAVAYARQPFGPSLMSVLVGQPDIDGYLEIYERGKVILDDAFLNFALHAGSTVFNAAQNSDSAVSLMQFHSTQYIVGTSNLSLELIDITPKVQGFKLPSDQGWKYHKTAPFIQYNWYNGYITTKAGESDESETTDPNKLADLMQTKAADLMKEQLDESAGKTLEQESKNQNDKIDEGKGGLLI